MRASDYPPFLAGGGEMGERIRRFDWSSTPLGPTDKWPQSLRSAVSILLPSRAQIVLFWGRDLITLYNDAYRPVFGAKHPRVLGLPAREAWSELWEGSGLRELFQGVLDTGEAYSARDRLFVMERFGYPEETYFDVSYDPVRDESGQVAGLFCIVTETTLRVLGERRLKTLKDLGARTIAEARSVEAACTTAMQLLAENPHDLPFSALYTLDADEQSANKLGSSGLDQHSRAAPPRIDLRASEGWPFATVLETRCPIVVRHLDRHFGTLTSGVWPEPVHTAVVLPISRPGEERAAGFLVAGVSPRRPLDDSYRDFLNLVGGHVSTAIASAHAHEDAKRRAESLAELDRAKTAFFSNVSHEFRTPLTLMLGPVEELLAARNIDLAPATIGQLEVVNRNGLRLLRLVNTLLDFSRIEAGRMRAVYEPTDLFAYTAELASVFRSAFERAGLRFVVEGTHFTEPVFVDREMWEKVVLNLLSNAFKFTFEGGVTVTVSQAGGSAELRISDTGTGIPPDEMGRVFERFHRIRNQRGRTHEGSGIGLAMVHELVKLHGGAIRAESVFGEGTTFIVSVPFGSTHLPPDQIAATREATEHGMRAGAYVEEALRWLPDDTSDARFEVAAHDVALASTGARVAAVESVERPRVLVADDNADMRQYLVRLLAERYEVDAVPDGEAALQAIRARLPDLVLTDVMMPRVDGFELLRALRSDAVSRDVPVIMLSARAGEESRVVGMEAGADDYLAKPFGARELLARVGAHLQMARIRREAAESLRDADRRKDEFLAILAHELRGPLAPLRNMLEVMKHADEGAVVDLAHGTMERQVNLLVRLVDDLLDVSRITSNKLELRKECANLVSILDQALDACRPVAEESKVNVSVSLPEDAVSLHADPVRLGQVFTNLLHNAFKYTENGGHVWVTVERVDGAVEVTIRDTGIGIPPDKLPTIFDMFTQVDRSLERSQGGLGIGLTLVRRIVEMHGGTVTAHSAGLGHGSQFTVRLPVVAKPTTVSPEPQLGDVIKPVARRILVVDDNEDSADSLAMLLQQTGNETQTAHDGLQAVAVAEQFRPDVVLLDIGLPKLNGFDAASQIRQQPWGKDMKLIALTGWGQEQDRRKSADAGFDAHLVKPVDYSALMVLVASPTP